LAPGRIRREGLFNRVVIDQLVRRYGVPGFRLDVPYDDHLVSYALTFGMLLETFAVRLCRARPLQCRRPRECGMKSLRAALSVLGSYSVRRSALRRRRSSRSPRSIATVGRR